MTDYIEGDWHSTRRGWPDVARCVIGLHRPATRARLDGMRVQRCSCGRVRPVWTYLTRREARGKWQRRPAQPPLPPLETFEMYRRRIEDRS